ncbi:MAG: LLM class flavin-dependent oxidoreductase, partial [Sporichthyaceae bacterium]
YLKNHFMAVMDHYDFAGDHFGKIKGYEAYQVGADLINQLGMEEACNAYIEAQNWGTPDQIIAKYSERHDLVGDFSALVVLSYGGIPFEDAKNSARLFGEKVIPRVKKMWANSPRPAWH